MGPLEVFGRSTITRAHRKSFRFLTAVLLSSMLILSPLLLPRFIYKTADPDSEAVRAAQARPTIDLWRLPPSFEPNVGQADSCVRFLTRRPGHTVFLTPSETVIAFSDRSMPAMTVTGTACGSEQGVIRIKRVGGNPASVIEATDSLPGRTNYFRGNNPQNWRRNIPTYARVRYRNVYPGIDMVYRGNQGDLEYDFLVSPGSNPKAIQLHFEGADGLSLDEQGNLILRASGASFVQPAPVIYQERDGQRRKVPGGFVLRGADRVGFRVADYDSNATLVIDPVLVFSTYLGGNNSDSGSGVAVDPAGNLYITGGTMSSNFPTANSLQGSLGGFSDIFIAKLDPSGSTLLYSTYLGGSSSYGGERALGIAVDGTGSAYVVGKTDSNDFPTVDAIQPVLGGASDAFLVKLNPAGSELVYSTYFGGASVDTAAGVAVDQKGNAYFTGTTYSPDLPMKDAFQPQMGGHVLFKSSNGAAAWSASDSGAGDLTISAIAVDPRETSTLYAGSLGQGVFKTVDGGANWNVASSGLTNPYVDALAIDPSNSSVVFAGTRGGGVFKTMDGGHTWMNAGLVNLQVKALALDPMIRTTIYAGAWGGVFKSLDGASTWTSANTGLTNKLVMALAVDPRSTTTVYAGTFGGGVFKSTDGGLSWSEMNIGLSHKDVFSLAIDPVVTSNVYAGTGRGGGVYRTVTGGAAWTNTGLAGQVVKAVAIDPSNGLTIYAGSSGHGISKSTDGGLTWSATNLGLSNLDVNALSFDSGAPATLYAGTSGGAPDGFIAKVDSQGSGLVYASYLGGTGLEDAKAIALDSFGNAFITGHTDSADFPVKSAFQPALKGSRSAFVTKVSPSGSALVYSTYLGGEMSLQTAGSSGFGIAVDRSGNAYVTGTTNSTDFPLANALQPSLRGSWDAFITKFDPSGATLIYSTYLGGSGYDYGLGIAVGSTSNVFVAGDTESADFPLVNPIQAFFGGKRDAFVAELSSTGSALRFSTFLGGNDYDGATAIAVDAHGNTDVTGGTFSTDFPTLNALQPAKGGFVDAFVIKIAAPAAP